MPIKAPSDQQPVLSILIPAYNYADGVCRIVSPLLSEMRADIEILIHDDSSDSAVEAAIQELGIHDYLRYIRNSPALGAVPNWNSLLKKASGRYVILIHHDDFPLSETFASELLAELEKCGWPDALILSCLAYDVKNKTVRPCVCNPFRAFIGRHFPAYLFRRNVIGPPSVLVVRRDLFDGYDPELKWLVDVEAFFRFLKAKPRRLVFSRLMMASSTGLSNAISTSIKDRVTDITHNELIYLESKFPQRHCWALLRGTTLWEKFQLAMELIPWLIIRTASGLCNVLKDNASLTNAVNHRIHFLEPNPGSEGTG